jgi:hypothetical protein
MSTYKKAIALILAVSIALLLLATAALPVVEVSGQETRHEPTRQAEEGLFGAAPAVSSTETPDEPSVIRARLVTVRFEMLASADGLRPSERLLLNLFDDAVYMAVLDHTEANWSGSYSWIGHLEGIPHSQAILVVEDGLLVGNVRLPGRLFAVRRVDGPIHAVYEVDPSRLPPEAEPVTMTGAKEHLAGPAQSPMADDGSLIDVLVLYTADARNGAGGTHDMIALINLARDETNVSYANSGIFQRLRLIPPTEVNYSETGHLETDLGRLKDRADGQLEVAHGLREAYAADIVTLVVENGDYCGIGYTMETVSTGFADHAFNVVVRPGCLEWNLSFPHELGHNMAARHDWYVDDTSGQPYTYNHGYVHIAPTPTPSWRTVMAYDDECQASGVTCSRVPYWSNPDVTLDGVPMGVPAGTSTDCSTGTPTPNCDADNRWTLNSTRTTVANFVSGSLTEVWVNLNHTGPEQGTALLPYNTVTEGVYRLAANRHAWIHTGSYSEVLVMSNTGRLVIDRPMILHAVGGTVAIGD